MSTYVKGVINQLSQEDVTGRAMTAVYTPYSSTKKTALTDEAKASLTQEQIEAEQEKLLKVRQVKAEAILTTKRELSKGNIVVTNIDCYDVCTALIVNLLELNKEAKQNGTDPNEIGKALIFCTDSSLSRSGLKSLLSNTPGCSVITLDVDSAKPSKELEEQYAEYSKAISAKKKDAKEAKDAGEEVEEVDGALPFVKGSEVAKRIAWKMIVDIADTVFILTESSFKEGSNVRGQIARAGMKKQIPVYIVVPKQKPVLIQNFINIEKVATSYTFYENSGTFQYDPEEIVNKLLGKECEPQLKEAKYVEDLDSSTIKALLPKDNVTVDGAKEIKTAADKIICVHTSVLGKKDEDGKVCEGLPINLTENTPADIIEYINSVQEIVGNTLSLGNTVLAVADDSTGVTTLRALYYYLAQNPETEGNAIILQVSEPTGVEAAQYEAFIPALLATGKVKFVNCEFTQKSVTIPNPKKELTEKDPATVTRNIKPDFIADLIVEQVSSRTMYLDAKSEMSEICKPTVCFNEAKAPTVERYEFSFINEDLSSFAPKRVTFNKTEWLKQIPGVVKVKDCVNAILN